MRLHILYRILNQLFVHRSDNDFTRFGINTGAKFIFAAQIYQFTHAQNQYLHIERFRHIVIRTNRQTFHLILYGLLGRKQHKRNITCTLVSLHPTAQFVPVHFRHHHITNDDIRHQFRYHLPGNLSVSGRFYTKIQAQRITHERYKVFVIIYNQCKRLLPFFLIQFFH